MKTGLAFSLLGFVCLLGSATSQIPSYLCQLPDVRPDVPVDFPDIEKLGIESYEMTVEFTLPQVKQTDYYVEYYDSVLRMGRVESHQEGEYLQYMYRANTWEAWNIKGRKCQLNNLTDTPDFFRNYQNNWRYNPQGKPERRTVGPSAMFKMAYDVWVKENPKINKEDTESKRTMAYLGVLPHLHVRGEEAQAWRWCQTENTSVDFFFAADKSENAYNVKNPPLRVTFNGLRYGEEAKLSEQSYDIITFQPFINVGLHPFEIPAGMGCGRAADLPLREDKPALPTFDNNLLFYAEVVYRKVKASTQEDLGSYYNNFMFALDKPLGMLAYYYSPWNTTKGKDKDGKDIIQTFADAPEYTIYDLTYNYFYKVNYGSGKCEVGRTRRFTPSYVLPENGGFLDLNSPYVFFPNNEFSYLTKSYDRGLEIDVYEAVVEGYMMNSFTILPKVVATHSYLRGEEKTDNVVSVKHTPVQAELRLFREDKEVEEILTFNFFGFTTKVINQRRLFDVSRCFKNDDDYSFVTIGFDTAQGSMSSISDMDPTDLEYEMGKWFDMELDMKSTRVPTILIDLREELYVSLLVLQKPPLQLDFTETEEGRRVDGVEGLGLMTFDKCGTECLENENGKCWGFAMCGAVCYIGGESNQKIVDDKACTLYKRYTNETYMKTKERLIGFMTEQIQDQVNGKTITLVIKDQEVKLKAVSIQVTDAAQDDSTFEKMGNKLSDRMRVVQVGKKLKEGKVLGKVLFEECQRLCLDYQNCESLSFCLIDSKCTITTKHGDELQDGDMETDLQCRITSRKYADNFEVNAGFFLPVQAKKEMKVKDAEACARSCLKEDGFRCLSFDLCADDDGLLCELHTTHFLKTEARKESLKNKASCRHYTRKYSVEFKKHIDTKIKSETFKPLTNLNVEECAKTCMDYKQGKCSGFDFCQGKTSGDSSCIIIDSDPAKMEHVYSPVCTHYMRAEQEDEETSALRPYTNSYASGIGILCFIVGGVLGVAVVFGIAYMRVNRS